MIDRRGNDRARWFAAHKVETLSVLAVLSVLLIVLVTTRDDLSPARDLQGIGDQGPVAARDRATGQEPALPAGTGESRAGAPGAGNGAAGDDGQVDRGNLAKGAEEPGEVDVYSAAGATPRTDRFVPLLPTGGARPKNDAAPRDGKDRDGKNRSDDDRESDGDSPSMFDEEHDEDEELYARNEIIAGRVISESGTALVGVGVTATALNLFDVPPGVAVAPGDLQRYAVSDTAGQYRFDQLAAGEYRVNSVPTESYGMTQIQVRSGVDFADIVVKTQRHLSVVGTVTDTSGKPLAGALVQPQALGESGAYTDSAGQFQLQVQIPEQAKGLGIRTELYGYRGNMTLLGADQVSAGQAAPVTIALEPLKNHTIVTGLLRSAEDGSPVVRKTVRLYSPRQQQQYVATSKPDGRFTMTAVEAGDQYELLVAGGGGYATYLQPNVVVDENGLNLELLLEADENRTLAGQMVNLHGVPVANFSLVVRAAQPPFQSMRVTSDASGHFVLRNPPQGALVFESQSNPQIQVSGIQVSTMSEQTVALTLDIGRDEINGMVVGANGQPVAVPNVVASWRHVQHGITSTSVRRTAADSQGGFSFRELGPGVRTIIIDVQGYKTARVEHDAAVDGYTFTVQLEVDTAG